MREPTASAFDEAGETQTANGITVTSDEARQVRELIAARRWDVKLVFQSYLDARADDIPHQDLVSAIEKGIVGLESYARARKAGTTHEEVLDAHDNGFEWGLYYYAEFREADATHREAIEAKDVACYGELRKAGANHAEAFSIHGYAKTADNYRVVVDAYIKARGADATHTEIAEALDKGIGLPLYARARAVGIKHRVVLLVHAEGVLEQLITGMRVHNRS